MSVLDDEFQFGLQTVLEFPYLNAKDREIGKADLHPDVVPE